MPSGSERSSFGDGLPNRYVRRSVPPAIVRFGSPIQAVGPGQFAVFYRGDRVLGGGLIRQALGEERAFS